MDGYQFVAAYRKHPGQQVPVIVLSAARDLPEATAILAADGFIEKPFEIDHVLNTVAQFAGV
jgi:CheY-like chemotaxis protein